MKAKLTHYVFWAAILTVCFFLSGCQNMNQYSPLYQEVHKKVFWEKLEGGGVDAMATANLKAHMEAERLIGK